MSFEKINILGVGVTDAPEAQILEYIVETTQKKGKKVKIFTPNPEILVFAQHHPSFKSILNEADLALNDGVGLSWAGMVLQRPLKGRVTGVDLLEKLCKKVAASNAGMPNRPITVGFLGGRGGVAEKTADCLIRRYPGLKVAFAGTEWNSHSVDILFVAYGFPKQEEWIHNNINKIPVKVAMGVGGAFDYISGDVSRAPKFVRSLGLEWLFRLVVQPWRIKRQLALVEFVWLLLKEKFKKK